jgi:hypothetical protein
MADVAGTKQETMNAAQSGSLVERNETSNSNAQPMAWLFGDSAGLGASHDGECAS